MKIAPVHVTCSNCHFAVEDHRAKCPNCDLPITWPTVKPAAPAPAPVKAPTPPAPPQTQFKKK
jgi:hypothetical protein